LTGKVRVAAIPRYSLLDDPVFLLHQRFKFLTQFLPGVQRRAKLLQTFYFR
jgi:hypothetical protein